MYQRRVSDTL